MCLIDGTLSRPTTADQRGPERNVNEEVPLHFPDL